MATTKRADFPIREVAIGYLLSILAAEFLLFFAGQAFAGVILHSAIVLSLVVWSSTFGDQENARTLTALTFISILRLIAIISPLRFLQPDIQELALAIAMLTVAIIYLNVNNLNFSDIGAKLDFNLTQFGIALTGIVIGVLLALVDPQPIQTELVFPVSVEFFVSFVEVILFHGILLTTTSKSMGRFAGVMYTSVYYIALFAIFDYPPAVIAIQFLMNVLFASARIRTDQLMGVIIAQSIARVIYIFVAPIALTLL
ncbi:MAG: hypothetical protein AAF846_01470 [Chloroflexota bacterium]